MIFIATAISIFLPMTFGGPKMDIDFLDDNSLLIYGQYRDIARAKRETRLSTSEFRMKLVRLEQLARTCQWSLDHVTRIRLEANTKRFANVRNSIHLTCLLFEADFAILDLLQFGRPEERKVKIPKLAREREVRLKQLQRQLRDRALQERDRKILSMNPTSMIPVTV